MGRFRSKGDAILELNGRLRLEKWNLTRFRISEATGVTRPVPVRVAIIFTLVENTGAK